MKFPRESYLLPLGLAAAGIGFEVVRRAASTANAFAPTAEAASAAVDARPSIWNLVLPMQPRIAIVELFGAIQGGAKVGESVHLIDNLKSDKRIRAVIIEIDSPGGSAPASEYLYGAVSRLAARKPVIAFVRGVGASGSYMVACGATKIIALPSSIIGSIGVISIGPVAKDLLKRIGIDVTVSKSGPYKDMGALYRDPTKDELQKRDELIGQFFDNFVELVARSRTMSRDNVLKYATGEVFTGRRAAEYGLIDEVADMDRAIELASELGQVPPKVMYARPRRPLFQKLFSRIGSSFAEEIAESIESRLGGYVHYR